MLYLTYIIVSNVDLPRYGPVSRVIWISRIVVCVQHLFTVARMQKVTGSYSHWVGQRLKTLQGKIKSVKGKSWAPTFICCAQDTVGL